MIKTPCVVSSNWRKLLCISSMSLVLGACSASTFQVAATSGNNSPSVTAADFTNNELIISGSSLNTLTSLGLTQGATTFPLVIVSKTASLIVAALASSATVKYATPLQLLLNTASASTPVTLTVNLSGTQLTNFSSTGITDLATSNVMTLSTAGNVGIGTTSPSWKLDVYGGTQTAAFRTTDYVQTTTGSVITVSPGAATGNTYGAIQSYNTGGTVFANTVINGGGGNVGIGTTSPGSALTVVSATNPNLAAFSYTGAGDGGISIDAPVSHQALVNFSLAGGAYWSIGRNTSNQFWIFDQLNDTPVITISQADFVGIGTSFPTSLLQVGESVYLTPSTTGALFSTLGSIVSDSGTAAFGTLGSAAIFSIGAPKLAAVNNSVTTTNAMSAYIGGAPAASTHETLTNTSALYIANASVAGAGTATNAYGLNVNAPTGAANNYAAIFEGGNVGVGTASPQTNLDVNGMYHLSANGSQPVACAAGTDGNIARTSHYTMCICKSGTGWVSVNDGSTACVW